MSFSSSVGTFGGGVPAARLNVLEDERAAQHRRRAVRVGRRHQHGAFAEQSPARRFLELDALEAVALHVGDAVVQRDALVEERVLRPQQIDDAAVFPEDAVGEQRQLGAEILARIGAARRIREHRRIRHDLVQPLHVEPLMDEVARQRHRARIGEHAPSPACRAPPASLSLPSMPSCSSSSSGIVFQRKNESFDASSRSLIA